MSKYIQTDLLKFQHPAPKHPQHVPHSWEKLTYGAQVKYAQDDDSSPLLPTKRINIVQQIVGTLLYYSIVVNLTMITAPGSITAIISNVMGLAAKDKIGAAYINGQEPSPL